MATNDHYKNAQGERIENTQWHQVVAWGKLAELCDQLLEKGKKVAIEGKLVYRSYENKAGEKRYVSEVNCDELLLL
jgi:single-strand DNA-binding protein